MAKEFDDNEIEESYDEHVLQMKNSKELAKIFTKTRENFNPISRSASNILALTAKKNSEDDLFIELKDLLDDILDDTDHINNDFDKDVFVVEEERSLIKDEKTGEMKEFSNIDSIKLVLTTKEFNELTKEQKIDLIVFTNAYISEIDEAFTKYLQHMFDDESDDEDEDESSEKNDLENDEEFKDFQKRFAGSMIIENGVAYCNPKTESTTGPGMEDPNKLTKYTAKQDKGKLPITFVPTQFVRDVAKVREYGNNKYHSPANWVVVDKERYKDALMRHLLAYLDDEDSIDEESGLLHLWHAACNIAFLCEMKRPDWEKQKQLIIERDPEFKKRLEESDL